MWKNRTIALYIASIIQIFSVFLSEISFADDIALFYKGKFTDIDTSPIKWGLEELQGSEIAEQYYKEKFERPAITIQKYSYTDRTVEILHNVQSANSHGVRYISGIAWSNDVALTLPVIHKTKMNLVTSMSSASFLSADDRVISAFPSNSFMLDHLLRHLSNSKISCNKIGIIYAANSEYARDLSELAQRKLQINFRKFPILKHSILSSESISKIFTDNIVSTYNENDCLFLAMYEHDAGKIVAKILNKGNLPLLLFTDGLGETGSTFWQYIPQGQSLLVRGYGVFPWGDISKDKDHLAQYFYSKYKEKYSSTPESLSYFTFKALLISMVINKYVGTTDIPIKKIINEPTMIEKLKTIGITFTKDGYATARMSLIILKNGRHYLERL